MEERKGLIYVITNKVNGKQYVGQTISTLSSRWSGHKCDARRKDNAIACAILKYSPENFEIEAIEENIPYSQLDEREIEYIKKYNTVSPKGYNISYGGQAYKTEEEIELMRQRVMGEKNPMFGMCGELNGFYGQTHSEESREIMSKGQKKRWVDASGEDKEKEINRLRQMNYDYISKFGSPMTGKLQSQEAKDKISKAMSGRIMTEEHKRKIKENNHRRKRVVMIDKNTDEILMEFDTMTIACEWLRKNTKFTKAMAGQISNVCLNKIKTGYGYKWRYAD